MLMMRKWARTEDGVAAVEFALLVPIIMTLLVGIVDFGMFIHAHMRLEDLSRAAVQYVVLGGNPDDMPGAVIESSQLYDNSVAAGQPLVYTATHACECRDGVETSCDEPACDSDDYIRSFYKVEVEGSYTPILPYPGMQSPFALTGESRMQYDW